MLAVLHGDGAQRRERLRLVEHALGQVGVDPHALPLAGAERAALVPDGVRHPQAPQALYETGAPQGPHRALGRAHLHPGLGGEVGDRAGMAERVRRLEVHEGGDRQQRRVEALARQRPPPAPAPPRSPRPTSRPRRARRGSRRPLRLGGPPAPGRTAGRRACGPAPAPRERPRRGGRPRRTRPAARLARRSAPPRQRARPAIRARPTARTSRRGRRAPRRAARAARPARGPLRRARSSRRPCRDGRRRRTPARRGSGAAARCPTPASRMLAAVVRRPRGS